MTARGGAQRAARRRCRPGGAGRGDLAATAAARRVRRPADLAGAPGDHVGGGEPAGAGARPPAARRAARPREDLAGRHRRHRARRGPARHERSRARARRRPRVDPHEPRRRGRAVHRRDPPAPAAGRRGHVPRDGGLPARHRDRQGAVGALVAARSPAVHARRRHHAQRDDHRSAPRPVRVRRASRLLRARRARGDRRACRRDPRRTAHGRGRARDRAARTGHPAHRQPPAQAGP